MPELSQRTLGKVIHGLNEIVPDGVLTFMDSKDFWRTKLFEHGFPSWLIKFVISHGLNWSVIITKLYAAEDVKTENHQEIGHAFCQQMLNNLTVLAFEGSGRLTKDAIRRSLQLDGFEVSNSSLQRIDGPVSVEEEKSRLLAYLGALRLSQRDVISQHVRDTEDLFSDGKYHSAIGEARSALEAVIRDVVSILESKIANRSGSGTANQIEFLCTHQILSADEKAAFLSAWGFLSSGTHPGLSSEEHGRIGTILGFEFIQVLLIKCKSLPALA